MSVASDPATPSPRSTGLALIDAFVPFQSNGTSGVFVDRIRAVVFVVVVIPPLVWFMIRGRFIG